MATFDDTQLRRVLFNNGEGLDYTDLNGLQQWTYQKLAYLFGWSGVADWAVDSAATPGTIIDLETAYNAQAQTVIPFDMVFVPSPSRCYWAPNGVNMQVALVPGPMCLVVDDPDNLYPASVAAGTDSAIIWCHFGTLTDLTSQVLTFGAADPTNPRIDLIEVKAEWLDGTPTNRDFKDATTGVVTTQSFNKERFVRITYQVKQGTPSATPSFPACSAGFRPMAAVRIGAAWNAPIGTTMIYDMRMPLGRMRVVDVPANQIACEGPSPWTFDNTKFCITDATGTRYAYAICPTGSRTERLVGVGLHSAPAGTATCYLQSLAYGTAMPTNTIVADLNGNNDLFPSGSAGAFRTQTVVDLMDNIALNPSVTQYKNARAAGTRNGMPMWMDGFPHGIVRKRTSQADSLTHLAMTMAGNGSKVWVARFYIASGLLG